MAKAMEWNNRRPIENTPPVEGEIAYVEVGTIQVVFEYSDKIVVDVDDEGEAVEWRSGYLMKVLPQTIVYNNQQKTTVAYTFKEND